MAKDEFTEETYREAQEELARRLVEEKYRYFEPSGKGEEFIDMIGNGENFIILYSAANGIGKSTSLMNVLAHFMWHTGENEYFNSPLFKNFPFPKRIRVVSDPTNIEKNIIPSMEEWFPQGRYERFKGNKKFYSILKSDTGWELDIMTYEQKPREFEGVTLGIAVFDEPPPQAIFKATVTRMRKGGIIIIGATPLAGSAYLYDAFAKGEYDVEIEGADGSKMAYTRRIGYIEADIESACKVHGVRGHLEHSVIEQMIAEYDEDEKQARIYGKFQHLIGMVFKRFSRNVHVIPPFHVDRKNFAVYQYLDPHPRNPDAVLWIAVDRYGTKYVVDEMFIKPNDVDELAEEIKAKDSQYRIIWRKADPSAFNVNQHDADGKSLGDRLADRGVAYVKATKARSQSDRRIEDALNYTEIKGNMIKAPELYIFSTCKRTIFEMEHYQWQEYTGLNADKHNKKEKPVDKDDHMVECLGRALYDEVPFLEWIRETNQSARGMDVGYGGHTSKSDDPFD